MKQQDIAMIIVVAVFSVIAATLASNLLFSFTGGREQQAAMVEPISATFEQPDTAYFNSQSVDPTQIIRIGEYTNQTPFNQKPQQ